MNSFSGMIRNHKQRAGWVAAAAAFVMFVGWQWLPATRSDAAGKPQGPPQIAVDVVPATRADVPQYLEGLGTIQAFNTVTVTARVDGELQKIAFEEGQAVKKGDLLAQIDPRPFQAALAQVTATKAKDEAQLLSAKADLERYLTLAPRNLASKQTLDSQRALVSGLEAQIKGDQANIDNARTQLQYTTITAPIQGRTGIRRVDAGNNVRATDTNGIVVVTQLQPIALIFTLPEDALDAIGKALSAGSVSVAAMSRDGTVELDRGTVTLVDNQIDQTTGTIRLKAVFPNPQNRLWPGQFIDARVLVRTDHGALTIPPAAILRGPNGPFTYVVKSDSTVEVRPVKVGEETGSMVVVRDGLRENERVVISNQYRLQPGSHVKATQPQRPAPAVAENVPPSDAASAPAGRTAP